MLPNVFVVEKTSKQNKKKTLIRSTKVVSYIRTNPELYKEKEHDNPYNNNNL